MDLSQFESLREIVLRLSVATTLGAALGIDRDLHRKPAGMRVLALVSMTTAVVMMLSENLAAPSGGRSGDSILRTVQGVVSGIGFLGAGVILRRQGGDAVHGITTAATIWVAAILGIACGVAQWQLAGAGFAIAMSVLVLGRYVEAAVIRIGRQDEDDLKDRDASRP